MFSMETFDVHKFAINEYIPGGVLKENSIILTRYRLRCVPTFKLHRNFLAVTAADFYREHNQNESYGSSGTVAEVNCIRSRCLAINYSKSPLQLFVAWAQKRPFCVVNFSRFQLRRPGREHFTASHASLYFGPRLEHIYLD